MGAGLPPPGGQLPRHPLAPGWGPRRGAAAPPQPCDQGVRVDRHPRPRPRSARPVPSSLRLLLLQRCPQPPSQLRRCAHARAVPSPAAQPDSFKLPAVTLCARAAPPLGSVLSTRVPPRVPRPAAPRRICPAHFGIRASVPTQVRNLEWCSGRAWAGGGRRGCHFLISKLGNARTHPAEEGGATTR